MATLGKVHEEVREHYAKYARQESPCCEATSCCPPQDSFYSLDALRGVPADIANFSAGNGDPVTPASLQPGETVLDLGSGGGLDCFLAARQVGDQGHVIGVDMTPEMLTKARSNAQRLGLKNVEFREGLLESLPVDDNSVDVVISNCVINLSPDKPRVFAEIFRALKPGGRMSVSDSVTNRPVCSQQRENVEDWCGCVSGALPYDQYVEELAKAGFVDIKLEPNIGLAKQALAGAGVQIGSEEKLRDALLGWRELGVSVFLPHLISARKPA